MRKLFIALLLIFYSSLSWAEVAVTLSGNATSKSSEPAPSTFSPVVQYKISETDMKILIRQLNNIEQCIFPALAKPNYQKIYDSWSDDEQMAMYYFQESILNDLIGTQNFHTLNTDPASKYYFNWLHGKLNNQIAHVDKERCEEFKPLYKRVKERLSQPVRLND